MTRRQARAEVKVAVVARLVALAVGIVIVLYGGFITVFAAIQVGTGLAAKDAFRAQARWVPAAVVRSGRLPRSHECRLSITFGGAAPRDVFVPDGCGVFGPGTIEAQVWGTRVTAVRSLGVTSATADNPQVELDDAYRGAGAGLLVVLLGGIIAWSGRPRRSPAITPTRSSPAASK